MIPFKRKGPLVFIQLLICAIILSWDAMLHGLEKTAQCEYNAVLTAGLSIVRMVHLE